MNLLKLIQDSTPGEWEVRTYPSGTVCVLMRQWVGPKSSAYGVGHLAANIDAYNIDFHNEKEIQSERYANATLIAASRTALPEALDLIGTLECAVFIAKSIMEHNGCSTLIQQGAINELAEFKAKWLLKGE